MFQSQAPTMKISSLFACFALIYANPEDVGHQLSPKTETESQGPTPNLMINVTQPPDCVEAGTTPTLTCNLSEPGARVWWTRDDKNLTTPDDPTSSAILQISTISRNDTGNYTCLAITQEGLLVNQRILIIVNEPGKIIGGNGARVKLKKPAGLSCHVQGYPLINFSWVKLTDPELSENLDSLQEVTWLNETYATMYLNFSSVSNQDNGTYECRVHDFREVVKAQRPLIVTDVPQVNIEFIKAVGASSVYMNWTVDDHNSPVLKYNIQHSKNGSNVFQHYKDKIDGNNLSYVLTGLENGTAYQFTISATNSDGESHQSKKLEWITTLDKDPDFIPTIEVKGASPDSITIRWSAPSNDLRDLVHYYRIKITHENFEEMSTCYGIPPDGYMFEKLHPGTKYLLQVAACSEYTKICGNWSVPKEHETLDGVASPPKNVSVECRYDNISSTSFVSVTWAPPDKPNGQITRYNIVLTGVAQFKDGTGLQDTDHWGPNTKSVDVTKIYSAEFEKVPLNTNYTVHISAVTRQRSSSGEEAKGECSMPMTIPSKTDLNQKSWRKIESQGRNLFRLRLQRISERNGPICCYRVFIVRLGHQQTIRDLPDPKDIEVSTYKEVHDSPMGGAYLAEIYDPDSNGPEIFIGDREASTGNAACQQCVGLRPKVSQSLLNFVPETQVTTPSAETTNSPASSPSIPETQATNKLERKRRRREDNWKVFSISLDSEQRAYLPEDGDLDPRSNYTGFIEVMVQSKEQGYFLAAYSGYLGQCYAGDVMDLELQDPTTLGIILQICVGLLVIVLIVLLGMWMFYRYLKHARQGGEEIISLRNSFRHLCRTLRGRHQLVASSPPDMLPIARNELLQAYIDRHRDSDYGFQQEFELLPDRFADRTTRASEARENLYKNRYPDIKCYDQTRVRLVQVDGICGSDYINANFVLGYKERKKFICAQGPMENTVCDYWRMIWEQHLEVVLMLTNLEEYSKTKCAKYWPDKDESKSFGDITVDHVRERPYSDYVVRELKMTRTGERDSRIIVQYHFLVWKDFMAPEHPHAILKFIKRVNEAYSLEKGPILVHCSAGVGRTGTLVALDSLLQQLADEGHVSIFNTVCDLRHQRNFLVQSLKQYIFVYRALMEMAQFGDTEIHATQLKSAVEKLKQRDNGKDKSKIEEEYDKISSVLEDRKSFAVGGGDENRTKNRNELVIPYDRNRVILTPVPGREHSTYINASFIEGYDNSESFIITQDPMEVTIPDFWRMISEQCASTIVMLSDLSEGPRKCPRYWPDDEISYDHIQVRYIQSESCPYYTRRELCIENAKTNENMVVTQYHYHGWPTVEGEVPEVTRGLIELVDQTIDNDVESAGPVVVHCNCGSDRSSMFVALSILVQQLRTERRVDIFTTTKKLRSQRHGMIGSFAQYEFLHRAIVNYSDLHNLAEEETAS